MTRVQGGPDLLRVTLITGARGRVQTLIYLLSADQWGINDTF